MFRRMTLVSMLLMLALLTSVGYAQQSNPQQSGQQGSSQTGQQGSSQTGQSTDRTRTDSSNKTQKDRMQGDKSSSDKTRTQGDNVNTSMRQDNKLSSSDRDFAMKAAEGGKKEVAMSEMALRQSSNADVKAYAQKLVDDHTKANEELMSIASSKGITLPGDMHGMKSGMNNSSSTNPSSATGATSPNTETSGDMRKTDSGMKKSDKNMSQDAHGAMGKDHAMMESMGKMSGANFDREYIKGMLKDHKKDIDLFEKQARSGRDTELKAFAEKTLPTLREHYQMARDLAGKVGVTAENTNR